MSLELEKFIASHSSTKKIISVLKGWVKQKSARILFVKNFFPHYRNILLKILEKEFDSNFLNLNLSTRESVKYAKTIKIYGKEEFTFSSLKNLLAENNFSHQTKVYTKKDFSIKGDTISFWPIELDDPVRASFFGEELEKLEQFDAVYGTKIRSISEVPIGNVKVEEVGSFVELIGNSNQIFPNTILSFSEGTEEADETVSYDFIYPQLFFKRFDLLEQEVKRLSGLGYKIIIYTKHEKDLPSSLHRFVESTSDQIESGFVSKEIKTVLITDRELFGTIFLSKKTKETDSTKFLRQLEGEIQIGDFLVHEDYGIAVYGGITQEEEGMAHISLKYAEGDELLMPLTQANKLTKYIAPGEKPPAITRLGKGMWNRLKLKVKKSVGNLAKELLESFAKRELVRIKPLEEANSESYKKFVEEFEYEETEDQIVAIKQIEEDLKKDKPMNRLIVGDVGFGKTEVFMRAAFKVVESGKQVAILAPTTVLVAQHHTVLSDRFKNFPFTVTALSRFGTKDENKEVINKISNGSADIIVGTHKLLSGSVKFKNLGLLVIDEEQKFGVKQKELLKKINVDVHTITLSATPIPRTLSMALSQILDISIITTPPSGRKPIKTIVEHFKWPKVIEAIQFETKRGGQVYFVHNEVQTIGSIKEKLHSFMPELKIAVGHGQQPPEMLEQTMEDFYHKKYDVLLCTTIIENGLDMPNVNTLIVNKAQNFGLSQLYQLRGRVGRSEEQAYAYIYYTHKGDSDKHDSDKIIEGEETIEKQKIKSDKADQRLRAIDELQELGSGFSLASRDLEIRGAGNVLGREQHGNILNIGLGLYMQLLTEEIDRLKSLKN